MVCGSSQEHGTVCSVASERNADKQPCAAVLGDKRENSNLFIFFNMLKELLGSQVRLCFARMFVCDLFSK